MLIMGSDNPNMIYSPVSLNTALDTYSCMIGQNEAFDEIRSFIGNINYRRYHDVMDSDTGVYRIINRIWVNENKDITLDDCSVIRSYVYSMDMSDSKAATNEKNQYVSDMTDGFIKSTPTIFDNNTVTDVMNIVYFKDVWLDGDLKMTEDTYDFNNYDDSVSSVNMMMYSNDFYYENDTCYVIPMNYSTGMTFYAIYPKTDVESVDLTGIFDNKVFDDVDIKLPEFETEVTIGVTDYADSIGLSHFNECIPLYYDGSVDNEITQVAKIKVDHTGTEAAAVTEIITKSMSAMPGEALELVFDKPFAYMIEDVNGDIAFIGRVMTLNQ